MKKQVLALAISAVAAGGDGRDRQCQYLLFHVKNS